MKTTHRIYGSMLLLGITIGITFQACKKEKMACNNNDRHTPWLLKTETAGSPSTVGIEKGKRSNCVPGANKICCGNKFCIVTPLSGYEANIPNEIPDYLVGILEHTQAGKLKLSIPHNKILPDTYANWFANNIFEAEYFPLPENVTTTLGLTHIAITEGNYPVSFTPNGYEIIIDYQNQIPETVEVAE